MRLWGLSGPFRVRVVDEIRTEKGRRLYGCHQWAPRDITIVSDLRGDSRRNVLWHEWIHGMLADGGVALRHNDAERVCDVLAAALTGSGTRLPVVK